MSLTFVTDREAWDRFASGSEKPHIMQSWGWGELKALSGWRPHRLVVERGGAWRAGLSVLERDFPKVGRRFFYASRGPLVAAGWEPADLAALFRRLEEFARERRAVFLKLDPDVAESLDWVSRPLREAGFSPAPSAGGFAGVQPRCVFRLGIEPSEEDLLKAMDQKSRYNIRLAEKKGVRVRPVRDSADVRTFHQILLETGKRDGFIVRPLDYFTHLQRFLEPAGQAQFFLAEADGKPLAGALALRFGAMAWYAYGASSNSDRRYMPNHLMQWTMIRWAKSLGCATYDFRAVPCEITEDNPLYGLYRFKKGFGGALTKFVGEFDRVYSPGWYALWTRGWPLFKKIRKIVMMRRKPDATPAMD